MSLRDRLNRFLDWTLGIPRAESSEAMRQRLARGAGPWSPKDIQAIEADTLAEAWELAENAAERQRKRDAWNAAIERVQASAAKLAEGASGTIEVKIESLDRGIAESDDPADNQGMSTIQQKGDTLSKLSFTIVGDEDESNIVVYIDGQMRVAHSTHPYFEKIVAGAREGDKSIAGLFDLAEAAASHFERLSERVSVANGKLYLDGEPIDNALTQQVIRFIDAGLDDWKPLVAFFENVQANSNEHSREQLFTWLAQQDFSITPDGLIVGYKGVRKTADGLFSINHGRAIVNGVVHNGAIPQPFGGIVEMPRSEVQHDPSVGCHRGLHVGTYDYANGFAQGALLEVHVNPRDVVSVPTDCSWAKMRVCRYSIVKLIDAPYTAPVVYADNAYDGWGDGEDYCDQCGEPTDECECW